MLRAGRSPDLSVLDAVVLATDPLSQVRIAGLAARERAVRVARRVGARRVLVIDGDRARGELARWHEAGNALLVIRADQLVHTPLVQPLVDHTAPPCGGAAGPGQAGTVEQTATAIAVGPDGEYAGALLATGGNVAGVIAAISAGTSDSAYVATLAAPTRVPHGAIARAPIATADDRRAAHRLLYRILVKPQDNAITRYLYRPVSFPLTRLLVWTPITPNQISYLVAVLVAIGCWLSAGASDNSATAGTAIVLAASYLDCCDGEIARVKLLSSRFGAWIDTIVDELSTVGYMAAIGWHCHLKYGAGYFGALPADPWKLAIAVTSVFFTISLYCIYYNIIVAVGSANSQDYIGRFDVVPGERPNSVRLRPAAPKPIAPKRELPGWLAWLATYAPYVVRRDFISWGALVLAAFHLTQVAFAGFVLGIVVTCIIVSVDHVRLRQLRRSIVRAGQILEAPST